MDRDSTETQQSTKDRIKLLMSSNEPINEERMAEILRLEVALLTGINERAVKKVSWHEDNEGNYIDVSLLADLDNALDLPFLLEIGFCFGNLTPGSISVFSDKQGELRIQFPIKRENLAAVLKPLLNAQKGNKEESTTKTSSVEVTEATSEDIVAWNSKASYPVN